MVQLPDTQIGLRTTPVRKVAHWLKQRVPIPFVRCKLANTIWNGIKWYDRLFSAKLVRSHYPSIIKRLRLKPQLRVAFLVTYDSMFSAKPLLDLMIEDERFKPFIIVTPDASRGQENSLCQMRKAYDSMCKQYARRIDVFLAYDYDEKQYIDFSSQMDLVCPTYPYAYVAHQYYRIEYLSSAGVLPFYIWYSFLFTMMPEYLSYKAIDLFWCVFVETPSHMLDYKKYTPLRGRNTKLTGYFKLDHYAKVSTRPHVRKVIIIAPHHTIDLYEGVRSSFLTFADLFLRLPKMFPGIDWIFRPHQILRLTLSCDKYWGKQKTDEYFAAMESNENVVVQHGGDYYETFANSDGMIHDCWSFLSEYLVTGKPVCYMQPDDAKYDSYFNAIGRKCKDACYAGITERDILSFVENVVLKGNDPLISRREDVFRNEIGINYPNASKVALDYIKEELCCEK